jgi:hypothetical protein
MGKKLAYFLIITVVMLSISYGLKSCYFTYNSAKGTVETFLQDFNTNKNKYQIKYAELNDLSSQGGLLNGYYEDENLKYIESSIFGETGKILYDIYFINNSLVYFVETHVKYDKTIYDEDFKVLEQNVREYLIKNDKIYQYNETLTLLDNDDIYKYLKVLNDFKKILSN